jgi:hypothetical protein
LNFNLKPCCNFNLHRRKSPENGVVEPEELHGIKYENTTLRHVASIEKLRQISLKPSPVPIYSFFKGSLKQNICWHTLKKFLFINLKRQITKKVGLLSFVYVSTTLLSFVSGKKSTLTIHLDAYT